MRLGIDLYALNLSYKGGVNSFAFGLIEALIATKPAGTALVVICERGKESELKAIIGDCVVLKVKKYRYISYCIETLSIVVKLNALRYALRTLYMRYIVGFSRIVEASCDVLYVPTTVLNDYSLAIPTLVSMHDLQHYRIPENFGCFERSWRSMRFELTAKYATHIQVSSALIKNDILTYLKSVRSECITIIPEGVNAKRFVITADLPDELRFLRKRLFLFYPAQLWKHKDHLTVLKAVGELERKYPGRYGLVLTGKKMSAWVDIKNYIAGNNLTSVVYLGVVSFDNIVLLYKYSWCSISASIYESSSLTILEALASGAAVIANDTDHNIHLSEFFNLTIFKTSNHKDLVEKIELMYQLQDAVKQAQQTRNSESLSRFSWDCISREYNDLALTLFKNNHNSSRLVPNASD
jgi:glycosyltransferase involved in cell wall biosynthesis